MEEDKNAKEEVFMEDKTNNKLTALLSAYSMINSEITYHQNCGDSNSIINVIPVAIVPLLNSLGATNIVLSIVVLFAPIIQIISLQRGLQEHTFVAMLRGYASFLEEKINLVIEENAFLYNSHLIDEYIARQTVKEHGKMKFSWFVTILMHLAIWIICVGFFIMFNLQSPWYFFVVATVVFSVYAIIIVKLTMAFIKKEEKRFSSKRFCYELNGQVTQD